MMIPYRKTVKDQEYTLGIMENYKIQYNFQDTLAFLEAKGKFIYGKKFKIYPEDLSLIYKLMIYTIKDQKNCHKLELDLEKGILLSGPIGCGKTTLINLIRFITPKQENYEIMSTRVISFDYLKRGHQVILDFATAKTYCFDDLGLEQHLKRYGNDCNVLREVLLTRYEEFKNHKAITHATTNLNAQELEAWYGNVVRSRMRELFNLIAFPKDAADKRS